MDTSMSSTESVNEPLETVVPSIFPEEDGDGAKWRLHEPARLNAGLEKELSFLDQVLNVLRGTSDLYGEQERVCGANVVVHQVHLDFRIHRRIGSKLAAVEFEHELGEDRVPVAEGDQSTERLAFTYPCALLGGGLPRSRS